MRVGRSVWLVLTSLFLVSGPPPLQAATLTQFVAVPAGTASFLPLTPFDPALGTLDSVRVSIDGSAMVPVLALPAFGSPPPGPYPYRVVVHQSFDGLAGKYFDSAGPATFQFDAIAAAGGGSYLLAGLYHYDFTFTAITDLAGFTAASMSGGGSLTAIPPLGGMIGERDDFEIQPPLGLDLLLITLTPDSTTAFGLAPGPILTGLPSAPGLMQIDYRYTPAEVPGPTALAAIGGGLVALACARLLRRRPRGEIRGASDERAPVEP